MIALVLGVCPFPAAEKQGKRRHSWRGHNHGLKQRADHHGASTADSNLKPWHCVHRRRIYLQLQLQDEAVTAIGGYEMAKNRENIIMTVMIPVITFHLLPHHVPDHGKGTFGTAADFQYILYTSVYSCLFALALGINVTSGRFDFSLGATMLLAIIVGGNIAKDYDLGAIGLLAVHSLIRYGHWPCMAQFV